MSIVSGPQYGEDDGIGGVVTPSQRHGGVIAPSAEFQISISATFLEAVKSLTMSRAGKET